MEIDIKIIKDSIFELSEELGLIAGLSLFLPNIWGDAPGWRDRMEQRDGFSPDFCCHHTQPATTMNQPTASLLVVIPIIHQYSP